jgi:hypothetical protein
MDSSTGSKRKRQTGAPRIIYKTAQRRFDRLFKEDSLLDLNHSIKKKLQLPENSVLRLVQVLGGEIVDLEDEDDFDAFYDLAHSSSDPVQINITIVDEGTIDPSTTQRSLNGEPPAKKKRVVTAKPSSKAGTSSRPPPTNSEPQKDSLPQAPPSATTNDTISPAQPSGKTATVESAPVATPLPAQTPHSSTKTTTKSDPPPEAPPSVDASGNKDLVASTGDAPAQSSATTVIGPAGPSGQSTQSTTAVETSGAKATSTKKAPVKRRKGKEPDSNPDTSDVAPLSAKAALKATVASPQNPAQDADSHPDPSTVPENPPQLSTKASIKPGFKLIKSKARPQTPDQLYKKIRNLKNLKKKISHQQSGIELRRRQFHATLLPGPPEDDADEENTNIDNGMNSSLQSSAQPTATPIPTIPDQKNDRQVETDSGPKTPNGASQEHESLASPSSLAPNTINATKTLNLSSHYSVNAPSPSEGIRGGSEENRLQNTGSRAPSPIPVVVASPDNTQTIVSQSNPTQMAPRCVLSDSSSSSDEPEDDTTYTQSRRLPRLAAPPLILSASSRSVKKPPPPLPESNVRERSDSSSSENPAEEASVTLALLTQGANSANPSPEQRPSPVAAEDPIESDDERAQPQTNPTPSSPITEFPPATPRGKKGLVGRMKDSTGQSPVKRGAQGLSDPNPSSLAATPVPQPKTNGKVIRDELSSQEPASANFRLQTPLPGKTQQGHNDSQPMSVVHWSTLDNPPDSPQPSSSYGMVDELHSDHNAGERLDLTPQNRLFLPSETQLEYPFSQFDNVVSAAARKTKQNEYEGSSDFSLNLPDEKGALPTTNSLEVVKPATRDKSPDSDSSGSESAEEAQTVSLNKGSLPARLSQSQSQPRPSPLAAATPRNKTPYRRLSDLASSMRLFGGATTNGPGSQTKFTTRNTPARSIRRLDYGNDEEDEESSSDSSDDDAEPAPHFPEGRRAGRPSQVKK